MMRKERLNVKSDATAVLMGWRLSLWNTQEASQGCAQDPANKNTKFLKNDFMYG